MDHVLHEVALLTSHTRQLIDPLSDPWMDQSSSHAPVPIPITNNLMENVNMLGALFNAPGSASITMTEESALDTDAEFKLFSETEAAVSGLFESEGLFGQIDTNQEHIHKVDHADDDVRNICIEANSSSTEGVFDESEKSAGVSDMDDLIYLISKQIEDISKSDVPSDEEESEDYFSASSQPDDESSDCRSRSISISSGHCSRFSSRSSRSSSISDVRSRSRSVGSSSGIRSRSSSFGSGLRRRTRSVERDHYTSESRSRSSSLSRHGSEVFDNSEIIPTEEFFGDVESLEVGKPFSHRRKKQLRMKKGKTSLATIYSPAVMTTTELSSGENEPKIPDSTKDNTPRKKSKVKKYNNSGRLLEFGQKHCSQTKTTDKLTEDGFTTEGSSLNPLAGAFIPRAFKRGMSSSCSDHDSVLESAPAQLSVNDSGFGSSNTTFNQTMANITTEKNRLSHIRDETIYESTSFEEYEKKNATSAHSILKSNQIPPASLSNAAPYKCSVNHDGEFVSLKDAYSLIKTTHHTHDSWQNLVDISQRVVRLCVKLKSDVDFELDRSNSYPPLYDNEQYGTGFAYNIGPDFIEIRTHMELVPSAEAASCTTATFCIEDLEINQRHRVELYGMGEGFRVNRFSRVSVLRCRTPPTMLPLMHVFRHVAVRAPPSLYDSAYSSEGDSRGSAEEASSSDAWDIGVCSSQLPVAPQTTEPAPLGAKWSSVTTPMVTPPVVATPPVTAMYSRGLQGEATTDVVQYNGDTYDVEWSPAILHEPTVCSTQQQQQQQGHPDDATRHLAQLDASAHLANKAAFEAIPSYEVQPPSAPRPLPLTGDYAASPARVLELAAKGNACLSPLKIMEGRACRARPPTCPYRDVTPLDGVAAYTCFSSYAGDVIDAARPRLPAPPADPAHKSTPGGGSQGFTTLLHAQNFYRRQYLDDVTTLNERQGVRAEHENMDIQQEGLLPWDFSVSDSFENNQNSPAASNEVFSSLCLMDSQEALAPVEEPKEFNFVDEWDRDLLNMDDSLNTLPPFGFLENFVDDIVGEKQQKNDDDDDCPSCERATKIDRTALIISFPHGGDKVVSRGVFSAHNHHGGDLYDTPTCMGSCGAPVLSINERGGGVYLSRLVHAGTTKAKGVSMGLGVAYFDDMEGQQVKNIWC